MSIPVKIKRSNVNGTPASLLEGELAFSNDYGTHTGDGSLYIGADDDASGVVVRKIGGVNVLDKTLFDANTILAANTDNTPAALTIPEQTIVGRITAGSIDALTATEVRTLLNVEDGAAADQNLFETVSGDTGSFAADGTTNTLSIIGSGDISTAVTDAVGTTTVTISYTGTGQPDQNLFETISGDTGSFAASGTTDTLSIVGESGVLNTVVTDSGATTTTTINVDSNGITDAKLRQSAGLSIIGRSAASTGNVADITASSQYDILHHNGTTLGFGQISSDFLSDVASIAMLDEAEAVTGAWTFNTALPTSTLAPSADNEFTTKGYVDGVAQGLDVKESVRIASTADIAGTYNSTGGTSGRGQFTAMSNANIDGVALAQGDRILLKDQTGSAAENGIWVITTLGTGSNGVWDRATDFDEDDEVTSGAFTFVEEGSTNGDTGWVLTTNDPITIGGASGTSLTFAQFSGAGTYTAGAGLQLDGSEFNVYGGLSGQVLVGQGVAADAAWGALDVANANSITGTLPSSHGGTGVATPALNSFLYGSAGDTMNVLAASSKQAMSSSTQEWVMIQQNGGTPAWGSNIDGGTY